MASLTMFEGRLGEAYSTFMIMNGANEGVQWGRRGGMGAREATVHIPIRSRMSHLMHPA